MAEMGGAFGSLALPLIFFRTIFSSGYFSFEHVSFIPFSFLQSSFFFLDHLSFDYFFLLISPFLSVELFPTGFGAFAILFFAILFYE